MYNIKSLNSVEKKAVHEIKYEFHKWKKQIVIADIVISIFIILLLGIFRPDYVVMAAYFFTIPYLLLTQRKILSYHLLVASSVAFIWMLIAKNEYRYSRDFAAIAGISMFPLFAWATGLFAIYLIYSHYEHILKKEGFIRKLLLFLAFYWLFLIVSETVVYHTFNIHNLATAEYKGLPICGCIHAPLWMQVSYFLLGPIFFTVCYILRLENPHFRIKRKYGL